jgi:hypothetical protein
MRTKGSCKFDAYYKVEWRDEKIGAWRPIQKSFATQEAAAQFAKTTKHALCRLISISEKGLKVI